MDKKLRVFAALVFLSTGGGIVYGSTLGLLSVGADSMTATSTSSYSILLFLIIGIILVAAGTLSAIFIISPGARNA